MRTPIAYVRTSDYVEDFPMTASGKVRKVDMRKTAIEMLGLADVAASRHA
jgi:fatty-acyl-CoA synthase